MRNIALNQHPLKIASLLALIVALAGCHYSSPFRYEEWPDEEKFGATFSDRLQVVRGLATTASGASPAEQEQIAADLSRRVMLESNELMRTELIRTLGSYPTQSSFNALAQAANDNSPRVRRVACEQLGKFRGAQSIQILSAALKDDADPEVRLAAARSLGELKDPSATPTLAYALDDANPAMQRRAMQSLAEVSGQDLGNNLAAWKAYTRNFVGEGREVIASQDGGAPVVPIGGNY